MSVRFEQRAQALAHQTRRAGDRDSRHVRSGSRAAGSSAASRPAAGRAASSRPSSRATARACSPRNLKTAATRRVARSPLLWCQTSVRSTSIVSPSTTQLVDRCRQLLQAAPSPSASLARIGLGAGDGRLGVRHVLVDAVGRAARGDRREVEAFEVGEQRRRAARRGRAWVVSFRASMAQIPGGLPLKSFDGKIAVITGGGTGMGRELATQLASEGCHVAICDVSEESMAETQALALAQAPAGRARHHASCRRLRRGAGARLPRRRGARARRPSTSTCSSTTRASAAAAASSLDDRAEWDKTFGVCWYGVYYCTRAFLPLLLASRRGASSTRAA